MKKIEIKGCDETFFVDVLDCGLPVIIWKNEHVKGYYLTLSVKYGSLDTDFYLGNKGYHVSQGLAHYLEHLNFHEPDGSDAQDFYAKNGSDVNAFTTFDYTSYEVYGVDYLPENLHHLLDFVLTPSFTSESVLEEQNIIIEENKMDFDNPSNLLYYGTFQSLFKTDRHQFFITGSKEDILKIRKEDLDLVYQAYYHPENMFLVVTGNVNPYEVVTIAKENLAKKTFLEFQHPKRKERREPAKVVTPYKEITANVEVERIRMAIKIPRKNFREKDDYKLRLMLTLLLQSNFGPTSPLYEELLENELILSLGCEKSILHDYVLLFLNAETKYPNELILKLEAALKHLKVDEKTITRKIHSAIANMVLSYDDITEVNMNIQEQLMHYGHILDCQKEVFESICLRDMKDVLKDYSCKEMCVVVLKQKK